VKPQVRWTGREWTLLAQYFIDAEISPDAYGFSKTLNDAQMSRLPPERWRSVKGVPATLKKELKEHITALEYKVAFATPYPPPEDKPPSAESLSTEDLLVELARRIAKLLEPAKSHPVDRAFFPPPMSQAPKEQEVPPRKLRILVCGPNGDTSQSLRTQFPNLDLRFYKYEENPTHIPMKAQGVNSILCITKFMTHAASDMVKATSIPFKMLTTVREAREWLAQQNMKSGED